MNSTVFKTMLGVMSTLVLTQTVPTFALADAADQPGSASTSTNAPARAAARTPEADVSEIIVTARRVEERLQDVPISISVFNQQQLNSLNIVNTQDLATYTPSVSVNNNFGNLNTAFAIRGFVQDIGTQPAVGVYFADVVAPRGAANNIPIGDGAGPGNFFDLQNVQVLKGPQGTLFGRNTTGGDILIVPQKPTSKYEGYVEGSYGNYAMNRIQAVVNLPLNDAVRLRLGVDHQSRQGYANNDTGIGPARFGDVKYTAARASLVADLTPDLENYTILSYMDSSVNGEFQKLVGCNPTPDPRNFLGLSACGQIAQEQAKGAGFYTLENSLTNPYTTLTQWQINNTTTWHATDTLTVKNIASYAELYERLRTPLFGTNFHFVFPPFVNPPGIPFDFANSIPIPGGYTADESTATEELRVQGTAANNRLNWQAGAYEENVEPLSTVGSQTPVLIDCTNADTFNCINPLGIGSLNYSAGKTYFNNAGLYEQTTYRLMDALKLTEGIRYTWDQTHNNSELRTYAVPSPGVGVPFCTNPTSTLPACGVRFRETSSAPTWLLGLDYQPIEDMLVYGKYSRGYRAGGVSAQAPSEFAVYKPEKVDTYEAGIKTSFHGAVSGTFNVAAFYNNFRDQQLQLNFNPKPGQAVSPASGILNAGKSRIYGLEVDSSVNLFEGFTLSASYTYLDTRIQEVTTVQTPATSPYVVVSPVSVGNTLPLSPKNKVSTTGTYTLPLSDRVGKVAVSATFTHTGSMVTNYVDATSPIPAISSLGTLPSLNLVNLNLSWNSIMGSGLSVAGFASNVTNKQYFTYVPGLYNTVGFETAELGMPRMYGLRVRYAW
jgi:iron complex outermembrane receptor protein